MDKRGDGSSVQPFLWIGFLAFYAVLASFVLTQAS